MQQDQHTWFKAILSYLSLVNITTVPPPLSEITSAPPLNVVTHNGVPFNIQNPVPDDTTTLSTTPPPPCAAILPANYLEENGLRPGLLVRELDPDLIFNETLKHEFLLYRFEQCPLNYKHPDAQSGKCAATIKHNLADKYGIPYGTLLVDVDYSQMEIEDQSVFRLEMNELCSEQEPAVGESKSKRTELRKFIDEMMDIACSMQPAQREKIIIPKLLLDVFKGLEIPCHFGPKNKTAGEADVQELKELMYTGTSISAIFLCVMCGTSLVAVIVVCWQKQLVMGRSDEKKKIVENGV